MLVSGHKLQTPTGSVNVVVVVDPQTGSALTMTAEQADHVADQIKSIATRVRLEVGN